MKKPEQRAAAATLAAGPYIPADYGLPEAVALKALQDGRATPDQQKRALDWLIRQVAATYEFHYYPTDRDTAFALGRAFVGQQVVKLLNLDLTSLRREHATSSTPAPQA